MHHLINFSGFARLRLAQSLKQTALAVVAMLLAVALLLSNMPRTAIAMSSAEVAVAEPAAYNGTYYYVKHGDSLSAIAMRYGVSVRVLMNANGIHNANHVYVGQRLLIPGGGGGYGQGGHSQGGYGQSGCIKVHYVQIGQNLSSIAAYYGVSSYALARANGIYNLNHIFVGQRLCIPGHQKPKPHPKPHQPQPKPQPPHPKPHPYPPQADCRHHQVKHGETLAKIANWYGTTVDGIVYANNLPNANHIYVGQPLIIPGTDCHHYPDPNPQPPGPKPHPDPQPTAGPKPTSGPGKSYEPGPAPQGHWLGHYYDNKDLAGAPRFTRKDAEIDFQWGDNGPGSDISGDNFSIHWRQSAYFEAGKYRFFATTDDGTILSVDDEKVIDVWWIQPTTMYYNDIDLTEGYHNIYVDYYEGTGNAQIKVWWTKVP